MKLVLSVLAGSLLLAFRAESLPLPNDPPPPLDIQIYDNYHQVLLDQHVHPDVVYRANWNNYNYWMAVTPYPFGNDPYENPSIVASMDGLDWDEPANIDNPIADPPTCPTGYRCYNNDPDLLFVGNQLVLYYNETHQTEGFTRIMRSTSNDGIIWTTSLAFQRTNYPLSPAVVYEPSAGDDYTMWFVQTTACGTGSVMRRTSEDGQNWPAATEVTVQINDLPAVPWHLDVQKVGGKYVMLFVGGCDPMSLYQAESLDGLTWKAFSTPVLQPSSPGLWDHPIIYRSSFLPNGNDAIRVWYSARTPPPYYWKVGYTSGATVDLVPPSKITNLGSDCIGRTGLLLQWNAPGEDSIFSTATSYEVRYSQSPITESNFHLATLAPNPPAPQPPGTYSEMPINGLQCRSYYFAMRTSDGHNWSPISNVFWARLKCSGILTCGTGDGMSPSFDAPRHAGISAPNPVTSATRITVDFSDDQEGQRYDLAIHDVAGRLVKALASGTASAGEHEIAWDVRSADGGRVREGVYYARLRVGDTVLTRTLIVTH